MHKSILTLVCALALVLVQPVTRWTAANAGAARLAGEAQAAGLTPTPTYDPLKEPVLPKDPSREEYGAYLYYYHCMPCHGDLGQGLTDDFRAVWVEDHQDCWNRGCHGGRPKDEGFPIPTYVPRVIAESDALGRFSRLEDLEAYLRQTHPPQYPGKLAEAEYAALSAYLWSGNHKPAASLDLQLPSTQITTPPAGTTGLQPARTPQAPGAPDWLSDGSAPASLSKNNSLLPLWGGGLLLLLMLIFLVGRWLRRTG